MPKKKPARIYSPQMLQSASGVLLFFLAVLLLLSPFTHLYPLSYALCFLFGLSGYYLLGAGLVFLSLYLIFLRRKMKLKARYILFYILLSFGAAVLFSSLFQVGATSYADIYASNLSSLPISPSIGGGLLGGLVYGTTGEIASFLSYIVAGMLIALGLGGLTFPLWKGLFKKKDPIEEKPSDEDEEEEDDDSFFAPAQGEQSQEEDSPLSHFSFTPAGKMAIPTRTQTYSSYHSSPSSRPVDVLAPESIENPSPSLYQSNPVRLSGLREAVFELEEEAPSSLPEAEPSLEEAPIEEEHPPIEAKTVPQDHSFSFEEQAALAESFAPSFLGEEAGEEPDQEKTPVMPVEEEGMPIEFVEPTPHPKPRIEPHPEPRIEPQPEPRVEPAPQPEPLPEPEPAPTPLPEPSAPPIHAEEPSKTPDIVEEETPYELPPVSLLKTYEEEDNRAAMEEECLNKMASINKTLEDLKAGAKVISYVIGPSTTRFDVQMDANVPVSTLTRYIQDIGIRLGGVSTRFVQVVPGHSTSALEVVNSEKRIVPFKEVFMGLPQGDKYNMVIPFGEDIEGRIVYADLSKFPHMLLAGTTGSGKSIFMHGIIMSLIMRNRPDQLKIALIDPKRVEMGKYKDLPHLLCPIVKEPSEAKILLKKLCEEMERRYTLLEENGVSGIREYNELMAEEGKKGMTFIAVFIDEYADLFESEKEVGEYVLKLAAKSRAAGIHLIVATQRPDVKVITGTIKSNLPVRVALSVKSFQDSRTILDASGAEDLAGHGDMLVDCELVSKEFVRAQGCLVDNHEIRRVTEFIRNQRKVVYDQTFADLTDPEAGGSEGGYDPNASLAPAPSAAELKSASQEEKYQMIKAVIMTREFTSISQIQRDFSVGFPRAGKIFARLQAEGIVARTGDAPNSSHGSRVIKHLDDTPSPQTDSLMQEQGDYSPDFEG